MVPCMMNGKPVRRKHHQIWDGVVRKVSQGLTLLSVAKGQWRHPDTQELVAERVIPVRFIATEKQMKQIADFTLMHYNQHTVLIYKVSDEVHFISNEQKLSCVRNV